MATGGGHQTQREEGEFGFFVIFTFFLFFLDILQTAKNYNTSQLRWRWEGTNESSHTVGWDGQLHLQRLLCGRARRGNRFLVPALGGLSLPSLSPLLEEVPGGPCFLPCPSSLCFLICWFVHIPGLLPSPPQPVTDLGGLEGAVCFLSAVARAGRRDRPCPGPPHLPRPQDCYPAWPGASPSQAQHRASGRYRGRQGCVCVP